MSKPVLSLDDLKARILPELFANPSRLGEYGASEDSKLAIDELSKLMETGAAAALADKVAEILAKMADASPEQISKPPSFMARMFGTDVERTVKYRFARHRLEELIADAEGMAQGVQDTLHSIDRLIGVHSQDTERLRTLIQAGREFLLENPSVGAVAEGAMEFDRPRERLARKLANLGTLLASHELSINQMKLTKAQALDLLDRFNETVSVLVPVWRQHSLTLITTKHISPALVAEASQAHQALMKSLSASLDGISKH